MGNNLQKNNYWPVRKDNEVAL